ncbi:reverse transcriptase domain-containing protein [Tanacetum coccineum]|uniref:Reverse transcriptase domain-containing protein n=1 Tax=Tanacetum coccineum TaxID=301880 RepID=A0ABQ5I0F8_9ASTR
MGDEHLDTIPETELDEVIKFSVVDLVPIPSESKGIPDKMCDVPFHDNSPPLDISKDQFEGFSDSNDDSTSIDDDSLSIDDFDYVEASPPDSELVSLEEVKDFHTEDGEIEDDILREKLSKINLLIAKIEAINSNPPLSSDFVTKSPSTFLNFFLEETNTFDNSIPESETFCFDLEENSSGSTTTRSDYSLPGYEAFYFDDDHIKEKSSGSTTTHSNISLSKYDSFVFDLSNDSFPPADRSGFYHEEFADELAHIISPPEYDCCYFKNEPDPGELTSIVDSRIHENVLSMINVNLPFEDDQSPLLAYVVWIFLPFLTKRISDKRTKNEAKTDKTEHGMEEREKVKFKKSRSKLPKKSTPTKSKVKAEADIEEMLNGPTRVGHTTVAAETPKAVTRVLVQDKQNLLLKNIITKEHPHEGWNRCHKVNVAQEGIGSQSQRGKSRVLRTICPNHGYVKKWFLSLLGSVTLIFQKTRMPSHIKTYDGSEYLKHHLKIFRAAAKTERWAMPTWCHMFNFTLTGNVRVWFDDLPPESIDSYYDLKKAFIKNYLQQKKCVKDPVEIHNIKQRDGESTEEFVWMYKLECKDVKGSPECMKISGFIHGNTNPKLIKRLHDKIPKSVDEMMRVTTTFLIGEVAASNRERKKSFQSWKQQEAAHKQNFKKGGFRNQQRPERKQDRFTLLTKTPKEILALDKGKFKPHPPMTTPVEKRNARKFYEFHGEVGHTTDESMHLKRQIEEMLKAGRMSHLIKELKQSNEKDQAKATQKEETSGKDKPLAILMVQPWQRVAKQRITQTVAPESVISFPP